MKLTILAGVSLVALSAVAAQAQDFIGAPAYGSLRFNGAPAELNVRAGGALGLYLLSDMCSGFGSAQPTAVVELGRAGTAFIAAGSDEDLTLAVRAPDGTVVCDDDTAGEFNPGVMLVNAAAGRYEIWVGTLSAGIGYPQTVLHVASDGFITDNPFVVRPDPSARGAQATTIRGGFADDPRRFTVQAGGPARLEGLGTDEMWCAGRASGQPDLEINYRGGALPLYVMLESEADNTLAIVGPDGAAACNDDRVGLNAGLVLNGAQPGRYAVFAGLLGDSTGETTAELTVSEIGYGGIDRRLDVGARPRFAETTLVEGFLPDPALFQVEAGGPVDLSVALADEMTAAGWCYGMVTREPSVRVIYDGSGPLHVSIESIGSEGGAALAVNTPDGSWHCDSSGAVGIDGLLMLEGAGAGVYDIYAGSFDDRRLPATIAVSEVGPGVDPSARMTEPGLIATVAEISLAPGFNPQAGVFEVFAGGLASPSLGQSPEMFWCPGQYNNAPSVEIDWAGGDLALGLAIADGDATLAVNLPDGTWICDDDAGEGLNSALFFPGGAPGVYDVFAGSFSGESLPATLTIQETSISDDVWEDHSH